MDASQALKWLKANGSKRVADGMARYGIVTELTALGVSMGAMQSFAKRLKKELDAEACHELAAELWLSAVYEAHMLACLVDSPAHVTRKQMDDWARSFDNWAVCDTACFHLFDKTPLAWSRVPAWCKAAGRRREFVKRAGFALMACLALHDKLTPDERFEPFLPLIERGAEDDRNFVRKGVSWALRSVGRRGPMLRRESIALARRLATAQAPAPRWVGKDALRDLTKLKLPRARVVARNSAGSIE